jgi:hypothetical protein
MNEKTWLEHINRPLLGPLGQPIPVNALMGRSIGCRFATIGIPAIRDKADISVTHGKLAQGTDTVF